MSDNAKFFTPIFGYSADKPEMVYADLVNAYRILRAGTYEGGAKVRPPSAMPFEAWIDRVERAGILPGWWDAQASRNGLLRYSEEDDWGRLDRQVTAMDIRNSLSPPGRIMGLEMMIERVLNS
jgi:hypothetical protein